MQGLSHPPKPTAFVGKRAASLQEKPPSVNASLMKLGNPGETSCPSSTTCHPPKRRRPLDQYG